MKTYYKFLKLDGKKIVSAHGNSPWVIGEWREDKRIPKNCERGFHCSDDIYQAFSFVAGTVLAKVEVGGKSDVDVDKSSHQKMRIVQAWEWDKTTSIKLAIYAAELVIDIYEKQYSKDDRPRKAIEAAKKYLKKPTADAAYAARDAAYAADAAADAARAAAYAADAAADAADAAYAAYAAAYAAARAAADADLTKKINTYMLKLAKDLKELK